METFKSIIPIILKHEGGFVNHPKDPGGATNYGISIRYLKTLGEYGDIDGDGDVDIDDIKALTPEKASQLYFRDYYLPIKANKYKNKLVALHILDHAVNAGVQTGIKVLQRALNVDDDGIIGNVTLNAENNASDNIIQSIINERIKYYNNVVQNNPKLKIFLKGWLNRVNSTKL